MKKILLMLLLLYPVYGYTATPNGHTYIDAQCHKYGTPPTTYNQKIRIMQTCWGAVGYENVYPNFIKFLGVNTGWDLYHMMNVFNYAMLPYMEKTPPITQAEKDQALFQEFIGEQIADEMKKYTNGNKEQAAAIIHNMIERNIPISK